MSKNPTNLLTTGQYLEKVNAEDLKKRGKPITRQSIWLAAKEGNISLLPSVKKIHRVGSYYLLEVSG